MTRRLRKDGSTYFGPYFPGNLAHRLVHFIHRHFPGALLQGGSDALPPQAVPAIPHPPLPGAVRGGADHRRGLRRARCATCGCFWKAGTRDLARELRARMEAASEEMRFEEAAGAARPAGHRRRDGRAAEDGRRQGRRHRHLRLLRRAAAGGAQPLPPAQRPDRGPPRVLLGRPARVRRAASSSPRCSSRSTSTSSTSRPTSTCRWISRTARRWRSCSAEKRGRKVEIRTPQRGQKKALLDLVETNAKHSFDARFRVLKPSSKAIQEALAGRAEPARAARRASSASTSPTSRAPTKWPAWWCGKTAG